MKKLIGYYLFAIIYYICKPLPIKKKRVLAISTHDDGGGSNVSLTVKALQELKQGYTFSHITKGQTLEVKGFQSLSGILFFFLTKPYQLARAEIILLDNVFLPMAYLKVKGNVKVIQLWHGTGTIKKFGQDVNTGKLKKLEYRSNQNITHLIVNSEETKKLYGKAFGIPLERVYPIGLPKTDELLELLFCANYEQDKEANISMKAALLTNYQIPESSRLILYAPTFRDHERKDPKLLERLEDMLRSLPKQYVIGLRLHPFVAEAFRNQQLPERVYQLSFEPDLNSLIIASDALITDYSSIIFEYCLMDKPMVFFAYDLEEFSDHGRGFYHDYMDYVPGAVVRTGEEVGRMFSDDCFDINQIRRFRERSYTNLDGKATTRLLELIQSSR